MAAGRGTRISRHIGDQPKCCLRVGDKPLIQHSVETILRQGINRVGVITGYRSEEVRRALDGLPVVQFENPFYDVTNSIASLWFARSFVSLDADLVLMNGDVFFEDDILKTLMAEERLPVLLADSARIEEADYRLAWENNLLTKYGKELTSSETTGEYVGMCRIQRSFLPLFMRRLNDLIHTQGHSKWWEDILYSFVGSDTPIYVKDIHGEFWAEMDFIEDYERVTAYLARP